MRLIWAQYALEDRRAIYDHIEADDARAAALVDTRISEAVARLIDYPESGRPGRVEGTRELVVGRTSCIAGYRVMGETVRIEVAPETPRFVSKAVSAVERPAAWSMSPTRHILRLPRQHAHLGDPVNYLGGRGEAAGVDLALVDQGVENTP